MPVAYIGDSFSILATNERKYLTINGHKEEGVRLIVKNDKNTCDFMIPIANVQEVINHLSRFVEEI